MMYRMHARVQKLEDARQAWWSSLSEDELEGLIGPRFIEYLDLQPLEGLERLANGDPAMDAQIWQGYLAWLEEVQS